jgi:hypothetical protein
MQNWLNQIALSTSCKGVFFVRLKARAGIEKNRRFAIKRMADRPTAEIARTREGKAARTAVSVTGNALPGSFESRNE